MIHKEGYSIIRNTLILSIIFIIGSLFFFCIATTLLISVIVLVLNSSILWFFRNPKRRLNVKYNEVVAPVDGKIVILKEVHEPEFFKKNALQISIFMSPLDVHVTRYPISGKIIYSKYHPGKYFIAWYPKASTKNEHTSLVIQTSAKQQVLFRQIAGFLARRIVLYGYKGDQAEAGKEFGFIKFGSRLDVFLPLDTEIYSCIGDKIIGGESILAKLSGIAI